MKIGERLVLWFFLLACLTGCGPRTLEDFQEEGEGVVRSLIQELHVIQSREDLLAASSKLQVHFDRLVTLMISAQEYLQSQSHTQQAVNMQPNHDLSDQLRMELNRIYRIEGCRQIIEKCQEKGLNRLDAAEKKRLVKEKGGS